MKRIELHPSALGSFVDGLGDAKQVRCETGRRGSLSGELYGAVSARMQGVVARSLILFRDTPIYDILVHARDEVGRALVDDPIDITVLDNRTTRIGRSSTPVVSGSLRARITSGLCEDDPCADNLQLNILVMANIVGALENLRMAVAGKLDSQIASLERLVNSAERSLREAEDGLAALSGTIGRRKKPTAAKKESELRISKTAAERALGVNRPKLERRRVMREEIAFCDPRIYLYLMSLMGADNQLESSLETYIDHFVRFLRSADGRRILDTCGLDLDTSVNFDTGRMIRELLSEEVELSADATEARDYSRRYSAAVSGRNRLIRWAGASTAIAVALVLLGLREVGKDLPAKLASVSEGLPVDVSRASVAPCSSTACPPDEEVMTDAIGKFHGGIIEELKREPFRVDLTIDPDDDTRVIFAVGKRALPADVMKVQFLLFPLANMEGGGIDQEAGTIGEILEDGSTTNKSYPEAQVRDALIRSGTISDEVNGEVNISVRTDSGRIAIVTVAIADFVTTINEQLVARWGLTPGAGNRRPDQKAGQDAQPEASPDAQ